MEVNVCYKEETKGLDVIFIDCDVNRREDKNCECVWKLSANTK